MAINPADLEITMQIESQLNAEMKSEPLSSPKRLLLLEMILVCMTYRKMNAN
jgi:hypothetical protein